MALTVFLVDDHRTFLAAAQSALATLDGVAVVGHAYCGRDALAQLEVLKPDMVLLDIGLPDISGIEVAMQLATWAQPPHILFVSLYDGVSYTAAQHAVGAMGYINKANFVTELFPLLEAIKHNPTRSTHK